MKKVLLMIAIACALSPSAFAQPAQPFFSAVAWAGFGEVPQEVGIVEARELCEEGFEIFYGPDLCHVGNPVVNSNCPITPAPQGHGPGLTVFNPQDFCPEGYDFTCYYKTKDVVECGD